MKSITFSGRKERKWKRMYIGVSGVDGSGKTTIIESISDFLREITKKKVVVCDAMKGGGYNAELRKTDGYLDGKRTFDTFFSPEIVNLAYCADLYENYHNIIQPALCGDRIVVSHRSRLCCKVYSEVFSAKMNLVNLLLNAVPFPDLLIYLRTSPEIALKRVYSREKKEGIPVGRKENLQVFKKANELYDIEIGKTSANIIVINGDQEKEKVEKEVREVLETYLTI